MCRLAAVTSGEYISPMEPIFALETMKEGHDGSGLGITMRDLNGEFEKLKEYPILSGICTRNGGRIIDEYMDKLGFELLHVWAPKIKKTKGVVPREYYFARVYDYPDSFKYRSIQEKEDLLLQTRLSLRKLGESDESLFVFSFYPDVLTLKEVGDPLQLGEFFGLDRDDVKARIVFAQGRQNTNYAIYLYACHPFFLQGCCSMTNGENTAFVPIREYPHGQEVPGVYGIQQRQRGIHPHSPLHGKTAAAILSPTTKMSSRPSRLLRSMRGRTVMSLRLIKQVPQDALHRRPELCYRLYARRHLFHGPGCKEAAARCCRRCEGQVCADVGGVWR